ncbi:MAG: outer membrane beta-barrel protein, partial [Gemmatimonadales bacterium]
SGSRLRGRFAAQFGTSVQANYAAEPRLGTLSGPDVSRYLQEAFVGYRVARGLWLDGGVFFSPFGSESWISRDNWTYTRSLIAENSPYYEAGVKATWKVTPPLTVQLHLINGWQNISETNSDKAVGLRVDYTVSPTWMLAYDGFLGNEAPDSIPAQKRLWQEGIVTMVLSDRIQLRGTLDYGTQRRRGDAGSAPWRGYAVLARCQLRPRVAVALRAEGYSDPEQIIVSTGQSYGLRASGWSFYADVVPQPRLLWRTEARRLASRDPLFTSRRDANGLSTKDPVVVSSLTLTF